MHTLLGVHTNISGGFPESVRMAEELRINCMQIFLKNARSWKFRDIPETEIAEYRELLKESNLENVIAHASYLPNLASHREDIIKKSITTLKGELTIAERLGIEWLVLHPGSATDGDKEAGIKRLVENLELVQDGSEVGISLETMAGAGNSLGGSFEELAEIIRRSSTKLSVTLDTCHIFAAGYNIRDNYQMVMNQFDSTIGIDRLASMHINDCRSECGSNLDRHEHIGKGNIGLAGFGRLMNDQSFRGIPKNLETPKQNNMDRINLDTLINLMLSDSI